MISNDLDTLKQQVFDLREKIDRQYASANPRLCLVIRFCEAMAASVEDRGVCTGLLDALAWRGLEDVCRDILRDLETAQASVVHADGLIMIDRAEIQGGAR